MRKRKTKNIFLLDMDGTITPPRKDISEEMTIILSDLCHYGDIGIVSGSDINFIMEQCGDAIIKSSFASHVSIMPCNGTKVYTFDGKGYNKIFSVSMIDELGEELYKKIIKGILRTQELIMDQFDFPITGSFMSYRESTLNWSLIGRNSSLENRELFVNRKDRDEIRIDAIEQFYAVSELEDEEICKIDFVLGGQTSIDIYPIGWDKTYALRHLDGREAWFIGDKCEDGENDYHLYENLNERSFKTSGPEETKKIINLIIDKLKENKK